MNSRLSAGPFRRGGGLLLPLSALLLAVFSLVSCGTALGGVERTDPPAGGPEAGVWEGEWGGPENPVEGPGEKNPEEGSFAEFSEEFPDEPDSVLTPEDPVESSGPEDLAEPVFDFPEAFREPPVPQERPLAALPEPLAPVFPEPEGEPADEDAGGSEVPASAVPVTAEESPPVPVEEPVPPASPPVLPSPPPAGSSPAIPPPPFLRPAEEYAVPPVREPLPPPVPPPPARTPPVEIPEPGILYSRVVRATVGQLVEIPFRGTGWVYLGELASRPGIVYGSRRLDPEGQSFIFRAEAAGTYGLKFYKQDFVRDYILNDHVQVIVGEPPEAAALGWFNPSVDRGRVIAEPRWPSAIEEAAAPGRPAQPPVAPSGAGGASGAAVTPSGSGGAQGAAAAPGGVRENVLPPVSDEGVIPLRPPAAVQAPEAAGQDAGLGDLRPGDYPERARREFEAGRVAAAISILDQFRERYPSGSDEAWWLYGQFYEANSPSRDIRTALDYYRRLVREYPQSPRYNEARRRIAYLERYYINIR